MIIECIIYTFQHAQSKKSQKIVDKQEILLYSNNYDIKG